MADDAKRNTLIIGLLTLILGVSVGIIIGYFAIPGRLSKQQKKTLELITQDTWRSKPEITKKFIDSIDGNHIRDNLKEFSREPHVAGTPRDEELAQLLKKMWLDYGMDHVELVPYHLLLSHPSPDTLNMIEILNSDNEVLVRIIPEEKPLREGDKSTHTAQAYHAFSPKGIVEGNLIFANNGLDKDFEILKNLGITVEGNILLVKHFSLMTFQKFVDRGVVGVLSFPTPEVNSNVGFEPKSVYPNTLFLPGTGIERTTVADFIQLLEDPLTPGYPATEDAYRTPLENITFPEIPTQPISFNDAIKLLSLLEGHEMPVNWTTVPEFEGYNIGPGFKDPKNVKIRLSVFNENNLTKVHNVIATIKGSVEPDRYIIMGNHRDAWSYGAVDPSSGTAVMMEIARVFGELIKDGWRPRRTIVFGSWAAEEFGMLGSHEWVEEKLPKIHERTVAYINTDTCAMGRRFAPVVMETLYDAFYHITTLIPDPKGLKNNLYDAWLEQTKAESPEAVKPKIRKGVSLDSDYVPFYFLGMIPFIDIAWRPEDGKRAQPTYHTGYDTFYTIEKFIDPTFNLHRSCGHLAGVMVQYLADSALIPFNMGSYYEAFFAILIEMANFSNSTRLHFGATVDRINDEFNELIRTANNWQENIKNMDTDNPYVVRMLNDQMMQFMRVSIFLPTPSKLSTVKFSIRNSVIGNFQAMIQGILMTVMSGSPDPTLEVMQIIERSASDLHIIFEQAKQILQPFYVP